MRPLSVFNSLLLGRFYAKTDLHVTFTMMGEWNNCSFGLLDAKLGLAWSEMK
jgi:hypothetical protein